MERATRRALCSGFLHTLKVDLVIVHLTREGELAAPWCHLEDVPDIIAIGVRHVELHSGTGAAGKRAEESSLTASAIGVQDVTVPLVPDGEGEVEARARITDETKRLSPSLRPHPPQLVGCVAPGCT